MKLKFKQQAYQTDAVLAVRDCFAGQPPSKGLKYAIDPGRVPQDGNAALPGMEADGFANASLAISPIKVLENLQSVQRRQGLPVSSELKKTSVCDLNLDIEMETGTGKIFTQRKEDVRKGLKVNKHVYDYVFTDSGGERTFAGELDASSEVIVYAKLPKTFAIPTPVGNYTPDWAIAFEANQVKHVYFVAETKGSMSTLQLKDIEKSKIACAKKFFAKITNDQVKYEMIDSYGKLMDLVK